MPIMNTPLGTILMPYTAPQEATQGYQIQMQNRQLQERERQFDESQAQQESQFSRRLADEQQAREEARQEQQRQEKMAAIKAFNDRLGKLSEAEALSMGPLLQQYGVGIQIGTDAQGNRTYTPVDIEEFRQKNRLPPASLDNGMRPVSEMLQEAGHQPQRRVPQSAQEAAPQRTPEQLEEMLVQGLGDFAQQPAQQQQPATPAAAAAQQQQQQTLAPALKRGDQGEQVMQWQRAIGMPETQVDGVFGPQTERATIAWNTARGFGQIPVVMPQAFEAATMTGASEAASNQRIDEALRTGGVLPDAPRADPARSANPEAAQKANLTEDVLLGPSVNMGQLRAMEQARMHPFFSMLPGAVNSADEARTKRFADAMMQSGLTAEQASTVADKFLNPILDREARERAAARAAAGRSMAVSLGNAGKARDAYMDGVQLAEKFSRANQATDQIEQFKELDEAFEIMAKNKLSVADNQVIFKLVKAANGSRPTDKDFERTVANPDLWGRVMNATSAAAVGHINDAERKRFTDAIKILRRKRYEAAKRIYKQITNSSQRMPDSMMQQGYVSYWESLMGGPTGFDFFDPNDFHQQARDISSGGGAGGTVITRESQSAQGQKQVDDMKKRPPNKDSADIAKDMVDFAETLK